MIRTKEMTAKMNKKTMNKPRQITKMKTRPNLKIIKMKTMRIPRKATAKLTQETKKRIKDGFNKKLLKVICQGI